MFRLYWWVPEGRSMSTIKDEEVLYQNLENLSWTIGRLRNTVSKVSSIHQDIRSRCLQVISHIKQREKIPPRDKFRLKNKFSKPQSEFESTCRCFAPRKTKHEKLHASFYTGNTIVLRCTGGFRGAFIWDPMMPRNVNLSASYAPDRCCFSSQVVCVIMFQLLGVL